jgi:NAD(P)-dependent dehydrogenase (short-subunit alcohol dehydrogenase family)
MLKLRGRRVVISGASSGIGLETARMLASNGAQVCLAARNAELLDTAVDEIGKAAWAWPCDVSDPAAVGRLVAEAQRRWGAIDGLVNNAGIAPMARLDETTDAVWDETFAVNVRGPFLLCREFGQLLHESTSPSVVNVSSNLAAKAIPGMAAYNASKAALNQLTRSLALEWAPRVRVNAVMPGVIDTPIHVTRGLSPEKVEAMGDIHPMGRVGQPRDVAAMIVFLLSDASSWVTGTVIPVDGGALAG